MPQVSPTKVYHAHNASGCGISAAFETGVSKQSNVLELLQCDVITLAHQERWKFYYVL